MPPKVGGAQKSAAAGILNNRPTTDSSGTVMKGDRGGRGSMPIFVENGPLAAIRQEEWGQLQTEHLDSFKERTFMKP